MKNYHKRKLWVKGVVVLLLSFLLACSGGNGNGGDGEIDSGSDVVDFQTSPDGNFVAYIADQNRDEVFELFVVELATLTVTPVSGTLVSGGDVLELKWAPDSSRIAYIADQDSNDTFELYTSEPDGASNVKVSGPLVAGGDVEDYEWAPDSSLIAYRADQATVNVVELYTSPPDGSIAPKKVSNLPDPVLFPGRSVISFAWAPDSSRIAYLANQDTVTVTELYSSTPDGSANDKVSFDPLVAGGNVQQGFAWAPDSAFIAYRADQENDEVFELFVAAIVAGVPAPPVKVSGSLVSDGDVEQFAWAPDSSRLAYLADEDTDSIVELYSNLPDGTDPQRPSGVPLDPSRNVIGFAWAPTSLFIAFVSDQAPSVPDTFDLYANFPDISLAPRRLSTGLINPGREVSEFEWEPEPPPVGLPQNARIAFLANKLDIDIFELYTVLDTGPPDILVSTPPIPNLIRIVESFAWAPDNAKIAFLAETGNSGVIELFTTDPIAPNIIVVSGSLVNGGNVVDFQWAPDSSYIVYLADQDSDDVFELFITDPNKNTNVIKISGPF